MDTLDGTDTTDELLLTDVAEDKGADGIEGHREPIDDDEAFPDTFDDVAPEPETPLLKQLRDTITQKSRENAELRRQIAPATIERKPEPDLWEDCEGDPDKFKVALKDWQRNEDRADEQERARTTEQQTVAQSWQQELEAYKSNAVKLGKPDFEAAETAVVSTLDVAQQSTIVMAAKDPARFIYALGRSPQRLAQIAQITNPIKLAAEVARIEGRSIMARKEPANIDTPLRGTARLSTPPTNAEEDRLLAEAEKTGDLTKLRAYRREKRAKAA